MRTVAYLGPEHTNTHMAALAKFGRKVEFVHAPTVEEVFHLVEREKADVGVVPIENSLEGAVTHTLDRFIDFKQSPVQVIGEILLPIGHFFITRPGVPLGDVDTVYSHPQALAQCRPWIQTHLKRGISLNETHSTAEAVRWVAEGVGDGKSFAAIGHKEAARQYRLAATPIRDDRDNRTRFLVIGLKDPAKIGRSKTSLLFALKDKPGALHDALMPFKQNRINLTKIESRPSKRKAWEYVFFLDIEGHSSQPAVQRALEALKKTTSMVRILGSYPMASGSRKSPE